MTARSIIGKVVSDKMTNTVIVEVERRIRHKVYKKIIKRTKRFKADTNTIPVQVGDMVKIQGVRPMSKDKHFKIIERIGG